MKFLQDPCKMSGKMLQENALFLQKSYKIL